MAEKVKFPGSCLYQPRFKKNKETRISPVWWLQIRKNGRLIRESTGEKDQKRAQDKLAKRWAEAERTEKIRVKRINKHPRLDPFLKAYQKDQAHSIEPATALRYDYCRKQLTDPKSPLQGVRLDKLTIGDVSSYITHRTKNGGHKATIIKEIAWLKTALGEARRQGLLSRDLLSDIRDEITPRKIPALRGANDSRERYLLPGEREIVLAAIPEKNQNLRDAFELGFWAGLRKENIENLREGHVHLDIDPPVLRFSPKEMKNKKGLVLRLGPEAAAIIRRLHSHSYPETPQKKFFHEFYSTWKRTNRHLRAEGRLDDFRFHDLRRTYDTYRLAAGIDPKTVQAELGHEDSRMTMDCYGRALGDPVVKAWAVENFAWGK